jgi:hypothetical protein
MTWASNISFLTRGQARNSAGFKTATMRTASNETPRLDWRAAQAIGQRLMEEQVAIHGFTIKRPIGLGYISEFGVYTYGVQGSRDVKDRGWNTSLWLDGDTGALRSLDLPIGKHSGDTVSSWLWALHFADVHDLLAYRIFV